MEEAPASTPSRSALAASRIRLDCCSSSLKNFSSRGNKFMSPIRLTNLKHSKYDNPVNFRHSAPKTEILLKTFLNPGAQQSAYCSSGVDTIPSAGQNNARSSLRAP